MNYLHISFMLISIILHSKFMECKKLNEEKLKSCIKPRMALEMIDIFPDNKEVADKYHWVVRQCALPDNFENYASLINDFKTRPEDVYLVTFTKSGTTWMLETLWLLMNNLDFERANKENLQDRSKYLDFSGLYKDAPYDSIAKSNNMTNPRLIKSHLPAGLLPKEIWQKKRKVVYVARNYMDLMVSTYHFERALNGVYDNMDDFIDEFKNNGIVYTPYMEHIIDFWKMRNEPNVFFTTYEEMKHNFASLIQKLRKFLGFSELNAKEMKRILKHLSFKNLKKNENVNPTQEIRDEVTPACTGKFNFMRRGIVGSYKDELTNKQQYKLKQWAHSVFSKEGINPKDIFGDF